MSVKAYKRKYRGFTSRRKPPAFLFIHKYRKARNHLQKPPNFWNQIPWTGETEINLCWNVGKQKVWRRKGRGHDPKQPRHVSNMVETA